MNAYVFVDKCSLLEIVYQLHERYNPQYCVSSTPLLYIGCSALCAVLPYFRWERGTWRGVGRHVSCVCWVAFPHFSSRPTVASWLRES